MANNKKEKENKIKQKSDKEERFIIKEVLEDISMEDKGLTLLTNPAGSGKSYETSLFIADQIINGDRKIYYITPRIKNLDDLYKGIISALKKKGREDLIDEVVKVDSFRNSVMNNSQFIVNDVTNKWKEAKELGEYIHIIKDKNIPEYTRKRLEKEIFEKVDNPEIKYRDKLKKEFRRDYKAVGFGKCSEYEFMKNSKWNFIEKLYTSSKTIEKQVSVLTSKKFFLKNDPIISSSYMFTEKENIEKALVIIDEIDAVKADMLDSILDNNFDNDVIDTFNIVYTVFQDIESMSQQIIEITNSREHINWIKKTSERIKDKYFPESWNIRCFDVENEGELEEKRIEKKVMNYQGVHSYYDEKKAYNYVPYISEKSNDISKEKRCNKIMPEKLIKEHYPNENKYIISSFLQEITIFLKKSFRILYNMSVNYMSIENKQISMNPRADELPINKRNSITTVLSHLHFDRDNSKKLADYIIESNEYRKYKMNFDIEDIGESIYTKGLYYSSISESDEFRHNIILNNYEIPYTPEMMLLDLSSKAHVIGVSATAEVNSINNFNLEFIKRGLKKIESDADFYEISEENRNKLIEDYKNKTERYKDIETKIIKIESDNETKVEYDLARLITGKTDLSRDNIKEISNKSAYKSKDNPNLEEYFDIKNNLKKIILSALDQSKKDKDRILHDYKRLKKVWSYIDKVVGLYKKEKIISNGIIITEKLVRTWDNTDELKDVYTLDNVKLGALYICAKHFTDEELDLSKRLEKSEEIIRDMFIKLDAYGLKKMKDFKEITKKKFINNELIFMLTSYSSVSRGNNLQVEIGKRNVKNRIKEGKLISINEWNNQGMVDWDSIYVEKPSYVIPVLKNQSKFINYDKVEDILTRDKEKLKTFFVVEEAAAHRGLSRNRKRKILSEVFDSFKNNYSYFPYYNSLYGIEPIKNDYSIFIYQTIGRISRTNVKKRYNAIFYDEEIVNAMEYEKEALNIPIVTNEFDRFLEKISIEKMNENKILEDKCNSKFRRENSNMYSAINTILNIGNDEKKGGWYPELQELWKGIRELALKNPVITKDKLKKVSGRFKNYKVACDVGFDVNDMYLKFSKSKQKYFYNMRSDKSSDYKNDFMDVLISNDNRENSVPSRDFKFEVSIDDCRLSMLLNNKDIRKYWKDNNYNTNWNVDDNEEIYGILCPVIYNNIYKGAIGEEVVKAILKKININYEEITDPNIYEKFDFIITKNNKKVYIDAKHFSESSLHKKYANIELSNKTNNKTKALNIDNAMVINTIDESGNRKIVKEGNTIYIPGIFKGKHINDCTIIRDNDYDENSKNRLDYIEEILNSI